MEQSTWIRINAHIYFHSFDSLSPIFSFSFPVSVYILFTLSLSLSRALTLSILPSVCRNVYFIIWLNVFAIWQVCLLPPLSSPFLIWFTYILWNDDDDDLSPPLHHVLLPIYMFCVFVFIYFYFCWYFQCGSSFHPSMLFLCSHLLGWVSVCVCVYSGDEKVKQKWHSVQKHNSTNALVCEMWLQ